MTVATLSQWVAGSRPRTLPASLVPVVVGTGVGIWQYRKEMARPEETLEVEEVLE